MTERVTGSSSPGSDSTAVASLRDVLLVHCRPKDISVVTGMIGDDPGCGVVLNDNNHKQAPQRLRHLARWVSPGRILFDTGSCAGADRKPARAPFSPDCIALQRDLGLWVLPDAGFVDQGDHEGLRSILRRTRELGPDAIAPLGLHRSWLREQHALDVLIEAVDEADVPVALMLEHEKDPFSSRPILLGMLRLIRESTRPVMVLRCDLSSIGLLCHGAHAAAVGTTTGLRHIYPISPGGGGRPPKPAALVGECLSYVSLEKIFTTVQAEPDNQLWVCGCLSCNGETIDGLQMRPTKDARETAAFVHSIEMLRELRTKLVVGVSFSDRAASWAAECDNALFRAEEMTRIDETWPRPKMLDHWAWVHPATRHP